MTALLRSPGAATATVQRHSGSCQSGVTSAIYLDWNAVERTLNDNTPAISSGVCVLCARHSTNAASGPGRLSIGKSGVWISSKGINGSQSSLFSGGVALTESDSVTGLGCHGDAANIAP